jgi:hypothetical protein
MAAATASLATSREAASRSSRAYCPPSMGALRVFCGTGRRFTPMTYEAVIAGGATGLCPRFCLGFVGFSNSAAARNAASALPFPSCAAAVDARVALFTGFPTFAVAALDGRRPRVAAATALWRGDRAFLAMFQNEEYPGRGAPPPSFPPPSGSGFPFPLTCLLLCTHGRKQERTRATAFFSMSALGLPGLRSQLLQFWERPESKKARRVGFHVVRAAKKFVVGTGNAAWVMGTTMLVMVMPLVFEIDREQQGLQGAGAPLEL